MMFRDMRNGTVSRDLLEGPNAQVNFLEDAVPKERFETWRRPPFHSCS